MLYIIFYGSIHGLVKKGEQLKVYAKGEGRTGGEEACILMLGEELL